jgi:Trk K+ transport system NAD-binding subunit
MAQAASTAGPAGCEPDRQRGSSFALERPVADADMLLAVTQSDEVNSWRKLAASHNTPTRIARIRSTDYLERRELFSKDNFCVNFSICPEQILTEYIVKLIEFPEALQVLEFAKANFLMWCALSGRA